MHNAKAELVIALDRPFEPHREAVLRIAGAGPIVASMTGCRQWISGGVPMAVLPVPALNDVPDADLRAVHATPYVGRWETEAVLLLTADAGRYDSRPAIAAVLNVYPEAATEDCAGAAKLMLHRFIHANIEVARG